MYAQKKKKKELPAKCLFLAVSLFLSNLIASDQSLVTEGFLRISGRSWFMNSVYLYTPIC